MNRDLELALSMADAADAITLRHFQSASLSTRIKADRTPVTEADEAVERMIRERLARERPEDGIVGEEFGTSGSQSRQWVLDPIDATKNYMRGIPVYGTLIALVEDGHPTAGVIASPAMNLRWWAAKGEGAWRNGRQLRVSAIDAIHDAHLGFDNATDFDPRGMTDAFLALVRRCARGRGFGDFWIHMMVAEGALDVAVEPQVAPWDVAAVQIIVEEAGGRFTDLGGNTRFDGGSAVSTNGRVHDAVLEHFR